MKRLLLLALILESCEFRPYHDPFILDQNEIANIAAFKEATEYILHNWNDYTYKQKSWKDAQSYLLSKGLRLKRFNEFHLDPLKDTGISYSDGSYIMAGDSVYKHSIIFSTKPMVEVLPTHEHRFLIKKIDTNYYYMVHIEKCVGC